MMKRLEQHKDCQYLPMSSFLLLPMQRITRLPLLVDAIRHRLDSGSPRHASATRALEYLNGVVRQCNEGAKKMLQIEQMCLLNDSLEFTKVKVHFGFILACALKGFFPFISWLGLVAGFVCNTGFALIPILPYYQSVMLHMLLIFEQNSSLWSGTSLSY